MGGGGGGSLKFLLLGVLLLLRRRSSSSSSPSSSSKAKNVSKSLLSLSVCLSGLEGEKALRFLFSVAVCVSPTKSLPPLFGYLSLGPFSLFSLSETHARVVPSYFPRRTFTFTFTHTNNIIMSSAVSSYLVVVSLYLFFFLLSLTLSLPGICCWCFVIPPGFYLLQNNNQSVNIHTPARVLHRVKQKLTTLL